MKHLHLSALALAVALYCLPAVAQHGHGAGGMAPGGGMGSGMSSGMGHGAGAGSASHGDMNGNMSKGSNPSSAHGMTMDQLLSKNTKLSDKIHSLTGMSAQDACDGFKNLGQCVAAAHVSKNLDISFDCLKSDMTGQAPASGANCPAGTGSNALSLGKSIQTLSPNADSKTESKKATKQANEDLKDSKS